MKESTTVYLIIFLIIAVIAFLLSNVFAGVFVIDNSNSTKLTAIENDGFQAHEIEDVQVIIPVSNFTNSTNNTTIFDNFTEDIIEVADDTWNELIG